MVLSSKRMGRSGGVEVLPCIKIGYRPWVPRSDLHPSIKIGYSSASIEIGYDFGNVLRLGTVRVRYCIKIGSRAKRYSSFSVLRLFRKKLKVFPESCPKYSLRRQLILRLQVLL